MRTVVVRRIDFREVRENEQILRIETERHFDWVFKKFAWQAFLFSHLQLGYK